MKCETARYQPGRAEFRLQGYVLVSVEMVVVVVFGRWVTVHSNMQFWKSRLKALGRMIQR
jgi:hypothetical protein